jgi:hypothetical protein
MKQTQHPLNFPLYHKNQLEPTVFANTINNYYSSKILYILFKPTLQRPIFLDTCMCVGGIRQSTIWSLAEWKIVTHTPSILCAGFQTRAPWTTPAIICNFFPNQKKLLALKYFLLLSHRFESDLDAWAWLICGGTPMGFQVIDLHGWN